MAKKKKSRQTDHAKHKIEEAQRRNEHFRRLRALCDLIHPDLYPMIDSFNRLVLYEMRGLPFKVVADGKVSKDMMNSVNEFANIIQKEKSIPLGTGGHKISVTEYNRYISPLEWLIRPSTPDSPNICLNADVFKGLPWYEEFFENREESFRTYYMQISELLMAITSFASDLRYSLYCAYFEEDFGSSKNTLDMTRHSNIHIQPYRVERKRIRLNNGDIRNALRITVAFPSHALQTVPENLRFIPMSFKPVHLGAKGPGSNKDRPVYVSEHALNRLEERLGCASAGYMQMFLCKSLMKGSSRELKDGRLMLDFEAFKLKIGYLIVSIQRNSILVHTFLLITANGTPEGKKLREQFGLQKADNQYLGIDKLTTFIHSNILQHEDVCEWFRNAGCGSLLKACEIMKDDELWQQDGEQIRLAERVKEYLKKGESTNAWEFTEEEETEEENDDMNDDEQEEVES
ncbi:MAG: hypothetical protein LBJ58_03570 [Tannerellaceae bacterium]|jgi:hypothetical protein|nr:hypothetical protein [Tannerellaceae bacterium]